MHDGSLHLTKLLSITLLALLTAACGGGSDKAALEAPIHMLRGLASAEPGVPSEPSPAVARMSATAAMLSSSSVGRRMVAGVSLDELFDYAEQTYPELFSQGSGTRLFDNYTYRFYPQTGLFLGVDGSENKLWLYQPSVDLSRMIDLGHVRNYSRLVTEWLDASAADIDIFVSGLRSGMVTALDLTDVRTQQSNDRLARLVLDETDGGLRLLGTVFSNCDLGNGQDQLVCTGGNFTRIESGAYRMRLVDGRYLITGVVTARLSPQGSLMAVVEAERRRDGILINDFKFDVQGTGLRDGSQTVSLSVPEFRIRAYESVTRWPRSLELNLSGLRIEGSDQQATASLLIPIEVSTSEGDRMRVELGTARFQRLIDGRGEEWWTPVSLAVRVNSEDSRGETLGLSLRADLRNFGTGFVPWMETSRGNFPSVRIEGSLGMAQTGQLGFMVESVSATSGAMAMELRHAGRSVIISAAMVRRFIDDDFELAPEGLVVTMSGTPFSANIRQRFNGDLEGEIFDRGRQIGVITKKGIIQVRGREVSIF